MLKNENEQILSKNSSLEDAQIKKNSNKNDESIRISGF